MIEDKLSHDERLRLECLNQAVALNTMKPLPSAESIVATAKVFQQYVEGGPARTVKTGPGSTYEV